MPRARHDPPPPELLRLGEALRALRRHRSMKQIELATAVGVSESQVSDVERGRNNPGWLLVCRLLDGLGASLGDLAEAYEAIAAE